MYLATVIEFYSNNFLPNFIEHNLLILLLLFKVRHFIRNGTKSSTSHPLSQCTGTGFLASPAYQDRSDNHTDLAMKWNYTGNYFGPNVLSWLPATCSSQSFLHNSEQGLNRFLAFIWWSVKINIQRLQLVTSTFILIWEVCGFMRALYSELYLSAKIHVLAQRGKTKHHHCFLLGNLGSPVWEEFNPFISVFYHCWMS